MAKINLDLTNVKAESASMFSVVESGKYTVTLAHSEFKETTSGYGLTVGFMIEEGPDTGKMIRDFINIKNNSKQAMEIGTARLKRIMEAQKRTNFKLSEDKDLVSSSKFEIELIKETNTFLDKNDKEVSGFRNNIKKILEIDGPSTVTKAATTKAKPVETAIETDTKKMPWEE